MRKNAPPVLGEIVYWDIFSGTDPNIATKLRGNQGKTIRIRKKLSHGFRYKKDGKLKSVDKNGKNVYVETILLEREPGDDYEDEKKTKTSKIAIKENVFFEIAIRVS